MKFGVDIPQTQLDALEARAHRLAGEVDRATSNSNDRRVRDTAGQIVDRIFEWVEEIKELREVGDEDVIERLKSFQSRLILAEKQISTWPSAKAAPKKRRAQKRRRRSPRAA